MAAEMRVLDKLNPKLKEHEDKMHANMILVNETKSSFLELKNLLNDEIQSTIKNSVVNEIKKFENNKMQKQPQIMGLSRIMNEGEDGFLKVLSLKAD